MNLKFIFDNKKIYKKSSKGHVSPTTKDNCDKNNSLNTVLFVVCY